MGFFSCFKKKKIVWQQYISSTFAVLVGAIFGIVIGLEVASGIDARYQAYLFLTIGLFVALFFHLIAHEAGHLVFGLLTGYEFSFFRIASFMWLKENGKLKLKRISIAGTIGQCLMTPPDIKDDKIPFVLYNLGGSFLNIVFGALFLVGYLFSSDSSLLSSFLFILALVGFWVAIMNGIPMRTRTVDNDGYNTLALSKNKEAVAAFWVQLKVNERLSKGVRLKDMPSEWFTVPADEAMKNSMVATGAVSTCNRLMDEGKFEEADELMAHLLEIDSGMVGLHRYLIMCDRIYVELIGRSRSEVIKSMMTKEQKKVMNAMKRFPSVLRTQYVLALLFEKEPAKAETIKKEFEKIAKNYPYSQDIESERDLMKYAEGKTVK